MKKNLSIKTVCLPSASFIFLFVAVLMAPLKVLADEAAVNEAKNNQQYENDALQVYVQNVAPIENLAANFTQTIQDSNGELLQTLAGNLLLTKNGAFYWQTQEPFPQQIVSNGETLWLYDPDLEQVIVREFQRDLVATPLLLLTGSETQITQQFTINFAEAGAANAQAFLLKPKAAEAGEVLFSQVSIVFVDGLLQAFEMEDSTGQRTEMLFTQAVLNQVVEQTQFNFVPPEGTEVLYE